jgi:hypothetical protein
MEASETDMDRIEEGIAISLLLEKVREYAAGRQSDVRSGLETPYFAALLFQKFAYGVIEAAAILFDDRRATDSIAGFADEEVMRIDREWRKHEQYRHAARPADILLHREAAESLEP